MEKIIAITVTRTFTIISTVFIEREFRSIRGRSVRSGTRAGLERIVLIWALIPFIEKPHRFEFPVWFGSVT